MLLSNRKNSTKFNTITSTASWICMMEPQPTIQSLEKYLKNIRTIQYWPGESYLTMCIKHYPKIKNKIVKKAQKLNKLLFQPLL